MAVYGNIAYEPDVDYSALMLSAKNLEEFETLAAKREAKIRGESLNLAQKGYAASEALLVQWQEAMARADERSRETAASISNEITNEFQSLIDSAPDMGKTFVDGIIEGIEREELALRQTVGRMTQDLRLSIQADLRPIQEQISASLSALAFDTVAAVKDGGSDNARNIAAAVRDALRGMSVNMSQRKVGELITQWQDNNDRGWDL